MSQFSGDFKNENFALSKEYFLSLCVFASLLQKVFVGWIKFRFWETALFVVQTLRDEKLGIVLSVAGVSAGLFPANALPGW